MKRSIFLATLFLCYASAGLAAPERAPKPTKMGKPNAAWIAKIKEFAPSKPTAQPKAKRKILLFSLFTGFNHKVIPYAVEAIKAIAEKSGAFELVISADVENFMPEKIKQFDAVILNNCCSDRAKRDLFWDVVNGKIADKKNRKLADKYKGLSAEEKKAKAALLEKSLIDFVANGGGLIAVHGGIVMQNNSMAFSEMLGGSFNYHPPQQELKLYPLEHPITKAFNGEPFIHVDEPYLFKNAYTKKNFRPLLMMKMSELKKVKKGSKDKEFYVSWIKRYGRGRVFFVSPSHNSASYESASMLKFYLNGIQYALGDLECDDTPIGK